MHEWRSVPICAARADAYGPGREVAAGGPRRQASEVNYMRLLPRFMRREEPPQETDCPRCGERAPIAAIECAVCGWDLRDAYHEPAAIRSRVAGQD